MSTMIMMLLAAGAFVEIAYNLDYAGFGGYPHNFFAVNKESVNPTDLFFKDDGTRMYVLSRHVGDKILEYNLDVAWDVRTAKYSTETTVIGSAEGNARGMFIGDNGTKLYICGTDTGAVLQYSLNPAWDISSASYVRQYSDGTRTSNPQAVNFKPDGSRMFVLTDQYIYHYELSSNWNLTTSSVTYYTAMYFSGYATAARGMFWKSDGSKLFVSDDSGDNIEVWNTPGNWSLLNTSFSHASNYLGTQQTTPEGLAFSSDGHRVYTVGVPDVVFQYDLSTAWDVGTNSLTFGNPTSDAFYVGDQCSQPKDIAFKPDGTRMFILDDGTNMIDVWALSTPWDINTAYLWTTNFNFSSSTTEYGAQGFHFGDNGSKLFILGRSRDTVYRFDLNTAWELSTGGSLNSNSYYVGSVETNPYGLVFSPDGHNFMIVGGSYYVRHYSLTTAWDLSSSNVTLEGSLFVGGKDSYPHELEFNDDGTVLYVLGNNNHTVYAWKLSTPYSLANVDYTNDFINSFCVGGLGRQLQGLAMKPDGSAFYVTGSERDSVFAINIRQEPGVFANISTATYSRESSLNLGNRYVQGVFFSPDGKKIYISSNTGLYDYTITETPLSRPFDISSYGNNTYSFSAPGISGTNYNAMPQQIFIAPDGKKLYYACYATDKVYYHTLSTAWYLSSISSSAVAEFQTAEARLKAVYFSPDGVYMFVTGFDSDVVRRHTLSTPWDITTAVQNQTAWVGSIPLGLWFSPHGDKMYVADNNSDSVQQWNLSSPWSLTGVSTNSYDDELDMSSRDNVPRGVFITPNGRNVYVHGGQHEKIYQFSL